ncbi:MAG TPA: baseplate J/gp47 family protein [Candidatus Limnocylindria bacterium]|nr:baseplate J/gp47 family protein [Candidatus Limnocylindria bacterium]
MRDPDRLLYLEPDDEITSVIRRLRAAEPGRVVIVAPGRCRAISSAMAVRLLARVAQQEGRSVAVVTDAAGRALVAQAGLDAFASLAEASVDGAMPAESVAPTSASIRVVRGPAPIEAEPTPADRLGETVARPVEAPTRLPAAASGRRALDPRRRAALVIALLVVALVAGAIGLPSATIRITPASVAVGPVEYSISLPAAGTERGQLSTELNGTPTGERIELVPAIGSVTFSNWNLSSAVSAPVGSQVAAGQVVFTTDEAVVVPAARLGSGNTLIASTASVAVTARDGGASGNVGAGEIDTVVDRQLRTQLDFPRNPNRIVTNPDSTTGGGEQSHTVVTQEDVDDLAGDVRSALVSDLVARLAENPERIYLVPASPDEPTVEIPVELVGSEDVTEFTLNGRLTFARPYVPRTDVEAAAANLLLADPAATPAGTAIVQSRIEVQVVAVSGSEESIQVQVTVRATASALIDAEVVRELAAGLTAAEAEDALADLGEVQIDLWPGWVDRVPSLGLRVTVETVVPDSSASPSATP